MEKFVALCFAFIVACLMMILTGWLSISALNSLFDLSIPLTWETIVAAGYLAFVIGGSKSKD